MKRFYCFINPLFDTWCICTLIVLYILAFFVFLIIRTAFFNLDTIILIVYVPVFILTFVLPFFIIKNNVCRILAIMHDNDEHTIFCQDGFSLNKIKINTSFSARFLINIAPYSFRGIINHYIYTSTTIFLSDNNLNEQSDYKKYNKIVIEDNYNNKNIQKLISIFKNYNNFSYDIKLPTNDDYFEQCEIRKNELINFIENNQQPDLLTKNLKIYSIIGSIFLYLLLGFIVFCTVSMLNWL